MSIEMVLAALEEYFEMKRDLGGSDEEPNIKDSRDRAGKALNFYIQRCFDSAIIEERRRHSSTTRKVATQNPDKNQFSYNNLVCLLDALNSCPGPLNNKQLEDKELRERWMKIYNEWYSEKRPESMRSISPPEGLELDLDLDDDK